MAQVVLQGGRGLVDPGCSAALARRDRSEGDQEIVFNDWFVRVSSNFQRPAPNASRSEREAYVKAWAALTISLFALLLAINGMYGGSNSSRVLGKTIEANNLWAWYQAKNVRATIFETAGNTARAADQRADMEEISAKARKAEAERDAAKERSPWFTYAGMALQLAIVLSSAAILAVMMPLLLGSVAVGAGGAALLIYAMVI